MTTPSGSSDAAPRSGTGTDGVTGTGSEDVGFLRVDAVRETERGLEAELHGERLRIDLIDTDLVRLAISRDGHFDDQPSYAVCVDPLSRPAPEFEFALDASTARLSTGRLSVTLWLDPFGIEVRRADGSPVIVPVVDDDGRGWSYARSGDGFVLRRRCSPDDAMFGLGEKAGRFDRRGREFTMWNLDVLNPFENAEFAARWPADHPRSDMTSVEFDPYYVNIPLLYHQSAQDSTMVGSFVDCPYRGHYDLTDPHEYRIAFDGGRYVEYVFAGPDMPGILADYTWLTGRAAPPPLWALGYHQCRWHRYSQDEVEALGARFRAADIPCDGLWLDIEHMDGYRVFTWNADLFPDAAGMLDRLADQGFRVVSIVDPGVKNEPGYPVFDDGLAADVFCRTADDTLYVGQVWPGETVFPDFATEPARRWWGALNARHVASGLAGIWNDMNEPATGMVPATGMRFEYGRQPHERYHNQYALLMAMATDEGLRTAFPDRRPFILSRAGFAGIQRYAANWLGDNQARWDHLRMSIAMTAGLGVSGQPLVGADIGGFMGDTDVELLVRWTQYGVLTPFCRNHSILGAADQYPWSFGEHAQELIADAVRLRYRLLPFLYASFLRACETGEPVARPMVFDHQYDADAAHLDDQYMLGPDLLVAPVTEPGVTRRPVRLPEGTWYDWHGDERLDGGRTVLAATPPEHIAVFVKAGAVLPMWPEAPRSTAGHHPEAIDLHVFCPEPGERGAGVLAEDDGLTVDGPRLTTSFTTERIGSQLRITATTEGRPPREFRRCALRVRLHGAVMAGASCDGIALSTAEREVEVPNAGTGFELIVRLAVG